MSRVITLSSDKEPIELNNKTILVTGGARFIGSFFIKRLIGEMKSDRIINIDNMSDYTHVALKEQRLSEIHEE